MERSIQPETPPQGLVLGGTSMDEPRRDFVYSSLDHKAPSIRLIRILKDLSPDGYIKCEIRHASIPSNYVCLSYVWGGPEECQWILLNDRRLWVRDNLWQFLQSARQKSHIRDEWLWIDALSINQANNTERGHQVQQMGQIYSSATRVISWFGTDANIENYFGCIASHRLFSFHDGAGFHASQYWKRAWITQEFVLARQSTFMAGKADVDSEKVPLFQFEGDTPVHDGGFIQSIARINSERSELKDQGIFYLLKKLRDKQCSDPRDRIFSVLALCNDCQDLKVDYDIPPQDLVGSILKSSESLLCFCSARFLADILDIECRPPATHRKAVAQPPFAYIKLSDVPRATLGYVSQPKSHDATNFEPHSQRKDFIINIDVSDICGHSANNKITISFQDPSPSLITMHINSTSTSTTFFDSAIDNITYSAHNPSSPETFPPEPVHGCTIHVSENPPSCTIQLSIDMFLELANHPATHKRYQALECCRWVTDKPGTTVGRGRYAKMKERHRLERVRMCNIIEMN